MTKTMARVFCAFNALVLFLAAAACGFVCSQAIGAPALAAACAGGMLALCGLANISAVVFIGAARLRVREAEKAEEKPVLTPGQMLANQRWQRRA